MGCGWGEGGAVDFCEGTTVDAGKCCVVLGIPLCYLVDDDDEEDEEEEVEVVGRFLRRCWLCGMPRCADR
jgi:hypothetical protein